MIEWHLILSRTGAKVYKTTNTKDPMKLVKEFKNPLGLERNRAFQTDRPGSQRFRVGKSSVVFSAKPKSEPHEEAAAKLTKVIAKWLFAETSKNKIERVSIFADPHMSGLLATHLNDFKSNVVWHHKNYSRKPYRDLNKIVRELKRA